MVLKLPSEFIAVSYWKLCGCSLLYKQMLMPWIWYKIWK